jgi:hypothetical protein
MLFFVEDRKMNRMFGTYQLREAAGFYWLVNMEQSGKDWLSPLRLNETGVLLLEHLAAGESEDALADFLADYYELPAEEAGADVRNFLKELNVHGITFPKTES